MEKQREKAKLTAVYDRLLATYGKQYWWPAETPFEVMVGAILTQSAAWLNVEKAIDGLKDAEALSPGVIRRAPLSELAQIIRPCGYFNSKAVKLKALSDWFGSRGDDVKNLHDIDTDSLRQELLAVYGVGPETADSILLYAIGRPVFVIDAYTRRIVSRLGLLPQTEGYDSCQRLFTANLEASSTLYGEYHALLVRLAKEACHKQQPLCTECCLSSDICSYNQRWR